MIPRRPSRIFRSRWAALLWAAGVLFTAVSFIGLGDKESHRAAAALEDATGTNVSNSDLAVLQNLIDG
ncbi:hypothetical protein P6144_06425 [Sphingomonas sp. HITSZ_GF]|uniref:hypothetical protein n=1 Tax=Sphingomonas sp. HITSZ_GF TaxID=3037247 RepID=UPI00240E399E|nr:hypothetical protein [Sphingomonas sp. HITSZ_GF]MDG2533275.1 hypothetical protein [Sphingomonas sp. HITSZ_GF]